MVVYMLMNGSVKHCQFNQPNSFNTAISNVDLILHSRLTDEVYVVEEG